MVQVADGGILEQLRRHHLAVLGEEGVHRALGEAVYDGDEHDGIKCDLEHPRLFLTLQLVEYLRHVHETRPPCITVRVARGKWKGERAVGMESGFSACDAP